ncbi:MAG: glycosyltransferase family 39 protein [Candidatus Brocadia sp.]|nr:glycosyltransferase family 39 protein [Candidatus Brocadia sp.]
MNNYHKLYVSFFLAIIFKGILFVIFIPLGQGPDEPNHFIHILAYTHQKNNEPLYRFYDFNRVSSRLRKSSDKEFDPVDDAGNWNYTIQNTAIIEDVFLILNKNNFWEFVDVPLPFPSTIEDVQKLSLEEYLSIRRYTTPLYFYSMATLLRWFGIEDTANQWFFLRFTSMFMGLGVVLFSFLTAKLIFKKHENNIVPLAAAVFVAFLPQFSFLSAIVNPDNLLFLFAAATLYVICLSYRSERKLKYFVLIMLLSCVCCLIKEQGVPVAMFAIFAISFIALNSENANPVERIYTIFQPIYVFLIFILFTGVIIYLFGDRVSLGRFFEVSHARSDNIFKTFLMPADYIRCFFIWFVSFWFSYGWMVYKMSVAWYSVFGIITFIGLIGIIKTILKKKKRENICGKCFFLMMFFVLLSLISVLIFYGPGHKGMQARHFFSALPAIAILLVTGIYNIAPQKSQNIAVGIFILFMVFVNVITVVKYIIPIYYL